MAHLDHIYLKLDRASARAVALVADITAFCDDHPIILDTQLREGRLGINLMCQMEGMTVPLMEWSLELGEIVYSLRSALDNLIYVCALIHSDPPSSPRSLQFPIFINANDYTNSVAVPKIVSQLSEDIANLLEKLQPYQRNRPDVEGNPEHDPLFLLNWISNHDKHRMPVPFLVPPKEIQFTQLCEFASEADATANVPPNVVVHLEPLSHGAILLEYRTKHPVKMVSGAYNMIAHVAFETHAGIREITDVIEQLTWYTRLVVDEFAKKIG